MSQPVWKFVANLGDVNPIDHGGYFVYVDETGVYPPEAVYLEVEGDDEANKWTEYRFSLEPCTFKDGILSDNKFHPEHPAWFAKPEKERKERPQDTTYLKTVADACGQTEEELIEQFCSDDPVQRAFSWREVGMCHGWRNLDDYPLEFTDRSEVEARYNEECKRR